MLQGTARPFEGDGAAFGVHLHPRGLRPGRAFTVGIGPGMGEQGVGPAVHPQALVPAHAIGQRPILQGHLGKPALTTRQLGIEGEREVVKAVGRLPDLADVAQLQHQPQALARGLHRHLAQVHRALRVGRVQRQGVTPFGSVVVTGRVVVLQHGVPLSRPGQRQCGTERDQLLTVPAGEHQTMALGRIVQPFGGQAELQPALCIGLDCQRRVQAAALQQLPAQISGQTLWHLGLQGHTAGRILRLTLQRHRLRCSWRVLHGHGRRCGRRGLVTPPDLHAAGCQSHRSMPLCVQLQGPGLQGLLALPVQQATRAGPRAPARRQGVEQHRMVGGIHHHQGRLPGMVHAPGDRTRPLGLGVQHHRLATGEDAVAAAQIGQLADGPVQGGRGVEVITPARAIAGRKHRIALALEALLGAVINDRNAWQGHDRSECLAQPGRCTAGQKAVDVVVVDKGRHPVWPAVQLHRQADALGQLRRRLATSQYIAQRAIQREMQHAGQHRAASRVAHIAFDLAHAGALARPVNGKAFAEHEEVGPAQLPRQPLHAGRLRIAAVHEVLQEVLRHIKGGVEPEGIHPYVAQPVAVALAQRAAHARVFGVEVVQPGHLVVQFLLAVAIVHHVGCPVVDAGTAVARVVGVVEVKGRLPGGRHGAAVAVGLPGQLALGIRHHAEEIAGVIEHDVLHQRHATAMQRPGQLPVVLQRAQVRVDAGKVGRPVTVVTAIAAVPPLVGHGRRDPDAGGAQALDVIDSPLQAGQIAAAETAAVLGVVFACTLVVVARIAVVKSVGHDEIQDLVAPVDPLHSGSLRDWGPDLGRLRPGRSRL